MSRYKYIYILVLLCVLFTACSSSKNTAGTRWYHSFNTRYNVYFNGDMAYQEALKSQMDNYKENYTETILMYPVSALPKDKTQTGGPFDRAIEKSVKAIQTHSIQTKPERKAGKRNDPKYKEWLSRVEYNPFLHNAWVLLGKSQFHNGDFLQAASTFSYVSRIYSGQPEIGLNAKIWQARCYSELEWFYEAEDILEKLKLVELPNKLKNFYETVYADLLIKQKKYRESVPYLQTAIKAEKNKTQKAREKYLLGQIYASLGERNLAYNTFGEISSAYAPYVLEFSAKIRQSEVYSGTDTTKVTKNLRKMAKSSKNKEYLDQLYYALGNVYMSVPDTAKAIESYELGVEKSAQQGIDKALNQIRLGDIYFVKREFIKAQPNYSESLSQLKKEDEAFARVSKRSEILDELVVHLEAIELQDSLLRLSAMSEEEKLKVVNNLIEELKKKEKEEQHNQDRENYLANQEDARAELSMNRPAPPGISPITKPNESSFYFYNSQVVTQGKNTFNQKWGRRKLEDDWRRRNKSNPMLDPLAEEENTTIESEEEIIEEEIELDENGEPIIPVEEEIGNTEDVAVELSTDPHDPQYYLQQIPTTEEEIEASNAIIAGGLYNAAVIYKEKLEDIPLALETFAELDRRFPNNEQSLDAYYHTYLIYLRDNNVAMSEMYKQKIIANFPESELAIAMSDSEYEQNLRMLYTLPESLYQETFEAYQNGNVNTVRSNYNLMNTKYNQSALMPKFIFLNALSYVQTNDANEFKEQLKDLITRYPDADVSVLAAEIMKGFQRGLVLSASGGNMLRGSLFNMRFGLNEDGELIEDVSNIVFSTATETPYELLILYPQGSLNDNMLLYSVANFNISNFLVNDFDLEKSETGDIGMLQIKGFANYREIHQYLEMIYASGGYAGELAQAAIVVPISVENYGILMKGKNIEEYMDFFIENFEKDNEDLIDRWLLKQEQELEGDKMSDVEEVTDYATEEMKEVVEEEEKEEIVEEASESVIVENKTDELEQQQVDSKTEEKVDEVVAEESNDLLDQSTETLNKVNEAVDEIMNDPIRGIGNIFKKKKSNAIDEYAKEQEKLDKERKKQLEKQKKEEEKALRELEKQKQKEEKEQAKILEKENKIKEQELAKKQKEEQMAKEEERKRIEQEEKEALRLRELEKEKEKERVKKEREDVKLQRELEKQQIREERERQKLEAKQRREELKQQRELEKEAAKQRRIQEKLDMQQRREAEKQAKQKNK
ncbi:tetratricopeptide (TPR) repeat protein [Dysgonomonadaceae bacterium PH5-43]|nr:tetratricopeptide (TPR) repeat protein [Dysgonomonadaceae bacterium PH5-43]